MLGREAAGGSCAHFFSSMVMPFIGVTSEPVAIMMFFVFSVFLLPSLAETSTVLGPVILPQPCT